MGDGRTEHRGTWNDDGGIRVKSTTYASSTMLLMLSRLMFRFMVARARAGCAAGLGSAVGSWGDTCHVVVRSIDHHTRASCIRAARIHTASRPQSPPDRRRSGSTDASTPPLAQRLVDAPDYNTPRSRRRRPIACCGGVAVVWAAAAHQGRGQPGTNHTPPAQQSTPGASECLLWVCRVGGCGSRE